MTVGGIIEASTSCVAPGTGGASEVYCATWKRYS